MQPINEIMEVEVTVQNKYSTHWRLIPTAVACSNNDELMFSLTDPFTSNLTAAERLSIVAN